MIINGLQSLLWPRGFWPVEAGPMPDFRPPREHAPPENRAASQQAPLAPRAALPPAPSQVSSYEEWQGRARAHTVPPGTYSGARVRKEMALALGQGAQATVGALGAAGATVLLASAVGGNDGDTHSGGMNRSQILALTAGPVLAGAATHMLGGIVGAVGKGRLSGPEALRATHKKFVADSAPDLAERPLHIREPVRRIDMVLESLFKQVEGGETADTARIDRLLRWRQQFLMALSSRPKVVTEWTTSAGRQALKTKIREAVKTFPEEVRPNLQNILLRIAANSVAGDDDGKRRLQFRFKGPGGTGKDTFIGLVKKVLDLPVVEIVVPPESNGGVESLLGKDWEAIEQAYPTSDEELLGSLGLALLKSGHSNTVVYLNEIKLDEQGVVNGLKRLLDPTKKSIEFKSLMTEIDWSHQTVFVASNDDINPDQALESRWETIELPRATRETKENVARHLHEHESNNYKKPLADGLSVLAPPLQIELDRIFEAVLPTFIDEHDKKFPGARMDFARSVTTFIAQELGEQTEAVEEKTRKFIVDHFKTIQAEGKLPSVPSPADEVQPAAKDD